LAPTSWCKHSPWEYGAGASVPHVAITGTTPAARHVQLPLHMTPLCSSQRVWPLYKYTAPLSNPLCCVPSARSSRPNPPRSPPDNLSPAQVATHMRVLTRQKSGKAAHLTNSMPD
jgi:hypothetical protein